MEAARIAELLLSFTGEAALSPVLLGQLQRYLDLLLRWNARVNLTAIRDPEQIVPVISANRYLRPGCCSPNVRLDRQASPMLVPAPVPRNSDEAVRTGARPDAH